MNLIKRLLLMAILIFITTGMIYAFDFGLNMSNGGGFSSLEKPDWFTENKENFWFRLPFDNSTNNYITAAGSVYTIKPVLESFSYYADLDLLHFSLLPVSEDTFSIGFTAGRMAVSDVTGFVLNQTLDGLEFDSSFKFGNVNFMTGYTGLLNARENDATMSIDDYQDANTDAIYALGSSRLIGKLTIQIPQFIGNAELVAEGIGQYDMRRFLETNPAELIDTAYGTLSLNGALANNLFYSVSGTYQAGITENNKTTTENSTIASIRFDSFISENNRMFAQFIYTPGSNDYFGEFLPVTFQTAGTLYTKGYDSLMKASAGWRFNPFEFVNVDFGGNVFLLSNVTAKQDMYNATEILSGATFRISQELKLRLDTSLLFPNEEDLQYQASLKAILEL